MTGCGDYAQPPEPVPAATKYFCTQLCDSRVPDPIIAARVVNLFAPVATQNKGGQAMSKIVSGILGTLAVSLSLGAAQYASGSDLVGLARQSTAGAAQATPQATTNREAKADRADAPRNTFQTKTISVSVDGLSDTSILVRVPVARKEARNTPAPVLTRRPVGRTVACEPVVSVLTEVAKQLPPGRCVT